MCAAYCIKLWLSHRPVTLFVLYWMYLFIQSFYCVTKFGGAGLGSGQRHKGHFCCLGIPVTAAGRQANSQTLRRNQQCTAGDGRSYRCACGAVEDASTVRVKPSVNEGELAWRGGSCGDCAGTWEGGALGEELGGRAVMRTRVNGGWSAGPVKRTESRAEWRSAWREAWEAWDSYQLRFVHKHICDFVHGIQKYYGTLPYATAVS